MVGFPYNSTIITIGNPVTYFFPYFKVVNSSFRVIKCRFNPKSPVVKAMAYALKLWDNMHYYTLHGHLQLDNKSIENAMRPIALGRPNHLFSSTHDTAQNAAMVYSLFATCKNMASIRKTRYLMCFTKSMTLNMMGNIAP
jgi:hypothetical protein